MNIDCFATYKPEDLVAIRRPARGMKDAELSDVEREKALELALEKPR